MVVGSTHVTRVRLCRYYLDRLRIADETYQKGHENSTEALNLFEHDWPQIRQWQGWITARAAHDPEAAGLCMAYARAGENILGLRQTPQEQIEWLQAPLELARSGPDADTELWCLYRMADAYNK